MTISAPTHSAATPTPATTGLYPFSPTPGTYEAIVAAAAVQHELECLFAALQAAGLPLSLVEQRLDAARTALTAASDAWMAGFPC
jgi:hypothetical protein